jgi:hypothetical protein
MGRILATALNGSISRCGGAIAINSNFLLNAQTVKQSSKYLLFGRTGAVIVVDCPLGKWWDALEIVGSWGGSSSDLRRT